MHIGISGYRGPHIDADGGCIDQFYMGDALCGDTFYMAGQCSPFNFASSPGNQAFQHHGGLPGAGDTGNDRKSSFGNIYFQRFYRMDGICGQ